jgi:hypothetical protein
MIAFDALYFEALMQGIPCAAFVRVYGRALGDARMKEAASRRRALVAFAP